MHRRNVIVGARFIIGAVVVAATLRAAAPADRSRDDAAIHHEQGVAFHLERSLDEASREYALTLSIDRPREPTADERALVERLAPRVFVTPAEPFRLIDVAAVLHPTEPLIAYHLFWDDDIDFPDDNDPCDHEVVWVGYGVDRSIDKILTYFHGRLLIGGASALKDAIGHNMRPFIATQWGKHGSMPFDWNGQTIVADQSETEAAFLPVGEPITLEEYNRGTYRRFFKEGARAADHPLARRNGWPRRFGGTPEEFVSFAKPVDVVRLLRDKRMVLVSRWNSAVINQQFLRYNFKPKLEWPGDEDGDERPATAMRALH